MTEIKGKPIKGFSYADGIHWHWGDREVAMIDQSTGEIEWCERKFNFPEEVIQAIRDRKPKPKGEWKIKVQPVKVSATQGYVDVYFNDTKIISWGDDSECTKDGWVFESDKKNPGDYVISLLYHSMDNLYHYSDLVKEFFKGKENN